ncbi:MAG: hypothetical protein Q8R00_03640 [Candidatus Nanoarchaeia archaeon]|nr:hypothetical protein [Candidatus Nanoarchaeia archaeon]
MLNKKGQEEFADIFTSILFIAVAVIIFALLSLFYGGDKQEVIGRFGPEIEAREELLVYMMTYVNDEKTVSDLVADSVNTNDFELFKMYTEANFKPDFEWIMFVLDSEGKQLFEIHNFEEIYSGYSYTVNDVQKFISLSGKDSAWYAEQLIPNYESEKPIKIDFYRLE